MSISSVVTRGFGSWGSVNDVVTRGFSIGAVAAVSPDGAAKMVASFQIPSVVQDLRVGRTVHSTRVPKVVK